MESTHGRRPPDQRRVTGSAGEDAVAGWYAAQGCEVLDRNWRVREGEIDVVVRCAGTIVFCEVKTRRSNAFGAPVEAVTARKQQRLRLLARLWLSTHTARAQHLRFDVASVTPAGSGTWAVDVLEAAF